MRTYVLLSANNRQWLLAEFYNDRSLSASIPISKPIVMEGQQPGKGETNVKPLLQCINQWESVLYLLKNTKDLWHFHKDFMINNIKYLKIFVNMKQYSIYFSHVFVIIIIVIRQSAYHHALS